MTEMLGTMKAFAKTPAGNAALTGLSVFMALYLNVVINSYAARALAGYEGGIWYALFWPAFGFTWLVLLSLAVFAGVALYVSRLKLLSLRESSFEAALAQCREELERHRNEAHAAAGKSDADLTAQLARCREEVRTARRERDDAKAALAAARTAAKAPGGDARFQAAKRSFARLYHPNNMHAEGIEKMIRTEVFKEYWAELEAIEKSGKG